MTNDRGKALDALIFKGRLHRLNAREFMLAQMFFASAGGSAGTDTTVTGSLPLTLASALAKPLLSLTREGKVEQRNLPQGYTEVEYLQTDGNAYIDTGVLQSNTDVFEITFQSPDTLVTPIMGAISGGTSYESTDNLCVTYTMVDNLSAYAVYCDGAAGHPIYAWIGGHRADGQKHTIKYNGLNVAPTLDGVAMTQLTSRTLVENTPTVTTWLFGRNNTESGILTQSGVRIFDVNIQGKGHFIPAKRLSDNVLGMYDLVSDTFFTNSGTGVFTAGAEVTPTPDRPMDLWCNNGVVRYGQYGKNLFDKDGVTIETEKAIGADGSLLNIAGVNLCASYIPVSPNTTYTFSGSVLGTSNKFLRVAQYKADQTFISRSEDSTGERSSYTFTTGADTHYIRFHYADIADISTYQLEQGATATAYEPYHFGIHTDGTPEVLTVSGKNLFDENGVILGYFYYDNGTYTSNASTFTSGKIPMSAGTTVTFSRGLSVSDVYLRIHAFNSNNEWIGLVAKSASVQGMFATGTTPANTSYIRVCGAKKNNDTEIDHECQVELGSTATTYEPYRAETASVPDLLAVGDYKDTAELISGLLTHKVGVKVLDGTEEWNTNQGNNIYTVVLENGLRPSGRMALMSTHYEGTNLVNGSMPVNSIKLSFSTLVPNYGLAFIKTAYSDVNDFRSFLTNQYAAGTPVIILYPLATETTEQTTPQPLTTSKGTNVVNSENNVPSVSATVVYKKR